MILGLMSSLTSAETYKVNVSKESDNLYKVNYQSGNVYIKTKYCYEIAMFDDAILVYDGYSYDNKIIFLSNNETCEVDKVLSSQ